LKARVRTVLGWPVVTRPHPKAAIFRAGDIHHDLLLGVGRHATPIPSGRRLGMYTLRGKVGDTDDDLRGDLVAGAVGCGSVHSLYVHDPDGNDVEPYVDIPDDGWRDSRARSSSHSSAGVHRSR